MITIISEHKDKVMTGTCIKCDCKVKCNESDTEYYSDWAGAGNRITCPACKDPWLWVK